MLSTIDTVHGFSARLPGMDDPTAPADLGQNDRFLELLAPRLYALSHRLHRHLVEATAAVGLPPALAMALRQLEPGRPLSMRALAGRLGCDPSYVTGIADWLEGRGLVERRTAARDRRVKELLLTPAGAATRENFLRRLERVPVRLDALSAAERAVLLDLLQRLFGDSAPGGCAEPVPAAGGATPAWRSPGIAGSAGGEPWG